MLHCSTAISLVGVSVARSFCFSDHVPRVSDQYFLYYADVSSVINMDGVFGGNRGALQLFNSDLSNWDVSKVTDMQAMFQKTWAFNQDLSKWDVSRVSKSSTDSFELVQTSLLYYQSSPLQ